MTVQEAVVALAAQVREAPWFVSVGVGTSAEGSTIFLYVARPVRRAELKPYAQGWEGFPVTIRVIGRVRPA